MVTKTEQDGQEVIRVQSAKRARRIQEEMANAGGYSVSGFERGFVVYSHVEPDGSITEVVAEKIKNRDFAVKKRRRKAGAAST